MIDLIPASLKLYLEDTMDQIDFTRQPQTDTCYFCGVKFHPQHIYTLTREAHGQGKPHKISVCQYRIVYDDAGRIETVEINDECKKLATEHGYEFRRDLTPTR